MTEITSKMLLIAYASLTVLATLSPAVNAQTSTVKTETIKTEANKTDTDKTDTVKIVMLGDSLTAGYGIDKDKAFPALVSKTFERKYPGRVRVVNAGVSGSTTASALKRLNWQLRGRDRPSILLLALGGNDGLRGLEVGASKKNLEEAIKLAKSSDIDVLLAGMKIPPNYGKAYTDQFEKMFADLAKDQAVPMIPFLLEGVGGEDSLNLPDGIHPNEKGHALIAETVFQYLLPLVEAQFAETKQPKSTKKALSP